MSDQDLVVSRWRRYGKDRLYVATLDGAKVGFWDLVADTGHPDSPECGPALLMAVTDWRARSGHQSAHDQVLDSNQHSVLSTTAPTSGDASTPELVPLIGCDSDDLTVGLPTPRAGEPIHPSHHPDSDPEGALLVVKPTRDVTPSEQARPWVDLAANRAGSEAREQARAAREAAPVKTVLARVLGVHTDERAWRIGADGEERVAAQLTKVAKKDPRWRYLHAIPVGTRGSDIDHVIIGPGGVFTANAKHHPDAKIWVGANTFMVNGTKQPYVRNARHEAQRAARLLTDACGFPVYVEGLIVTVNAADVVVKTQPEGVSVVPRMQVARWLLRHGDIHTSEAIDAIYEVARRSITWR